MGMVNIDLETKMFTMVATITMCGKMKTVLFNSLVAQLIGEE